MFILVFVKFIRRDFNGACYLLPVSLSMFLCSLSVQTYLLLLVFELFFVNFDVCEVLCCMWCLVWRKKILCTGNNFFTIKIWQFAILFIFYFDSDKLHANFDLILNFFVCMLSRKAGRQCWIDESCRFCSPSVFHNS